MPKICTIVHLRDKFDTTRNEPKASPNERRVVGACRECNQARAKERTKKFGSNPRGGVKNRTLCPTCGNLETKQIAPCSDPWHVQPKGGVVISKRRKRVRKPRWWMSDQFYAGLMIGFMGGWFIVTLFKTIWR